MNYELVIGVLGLTGIIVFGFFALWEPKEKKA